MDSSRCVRATREGGLLTKPLTLSGESLNLNFLTQTGGQIRVSLESPEGETLAQSEWLTGDQIAHPVEWQAGTGLPAFQGRAVRLRLSMKKADLYSIQFGPTVSQ